MRHSVDQPVGTHLVELVLFDLYFLLVGEVIIEVVSLQTYISTHPPTFPSTHPPTFPRTHPPTFPRTHPPTFPRTNPPTFPRTHPPTFPRTHPPTFPRTHPPTFHQKKQPNNSGIVSCNFFIDLYFPLQVVWITSTAVVSLDAIVAP